MRFWRTFASAFTIICLLASLVAFMPQATLATEAGRTQSEEESGSSGVRGSDQSSSSLSYNSTQGNQGDAEVQGQPGPSAYTDDQVQQVDSSLSYSQGQDQQAIDDPQFSEPIPVEEWYVDEHSDYKTTLDPIPVTSETHEIKNGVYIVRESMELEQTLWIGGKARLILADDVVLSVPKGIRVRKDATLTLYAQGDAAGSLLIRKGVKRYLTDEQKKKEEEEIARRREEDPTYVAPKPQLLFVWPCLDVTAGDHEPRPDDDEDPKHAPRHIDKPKLNDAFLCKDYLVIRPKVTHELEDKNGYYACATCGQNFEDLEAHVSLTAEQVQQIVEAQAAADDVLIGEASTVTISFDPNGGAGSMAPLEVESGQSFELPECPFTPPEGKVFSVWSLGAPGSVASVPTSTTVKAWWVDAPSGKGAGETQAQSSQTTGSQVQPSSQADDAQDASVTQATNNTPSSTSSSSGSQASTSGSPTTGDRIAEHFGALVLCLVGGAAFIVLGKSWR
ncbi:MAG: hypothetical protein IKF78_12995 [Atopobiaceae bacterium]|nr:hypothetical protein [Atopobiaceae bacterium]